MEPVSRTDVERSRSLGRPKGIVRGSDILGGKPPKMSEPLMHSRTPNDTLLPSQHLLDGVIKHSNDTIQSSYHPFDGPERRPPLLPPLFLGALLLFF